jgi:hypothetical protein
VGAEGLRWLDAPPEIEDDVATFVDFYDRYSDTPDSEIPADDIAALDDAATAIIAFVDERCPPATTTTGGWPHRAR